MHDLRFRQIHLDFHTSPAIPNIGTGFNKKQWQSALKQGHVNSITTFAVCHHGWNYNNTKVGTRHPNLSFDLLRAQYDASKEIDVNVPIYLTAGVSSRVAEEHPEWREVSPEGHYAGWNISPITPGFKNLCFNSPYTDYLCQLVEEVALQFPDCDGIFLDIISQTQCCCQYCIKSMLKEGLNPEVEADRQQMSLLSLDRYFKMVTAACRSTRSDIPVFHNSGHISRGNSRILKYFSHLELESLPTGGWGYDHFPVSAKYCKNLDLDFLGMTGKFHTTWGEFGGYKHPNALRYECAAMMAFGSKCSVGDQLHPSGEMDESTYSIIGDAYSEVETKEPWCVNVKNIADIGLLSSSAVNKGGRGEHVDEGAARILLEGHFLFDVLDADMSFEGYRVLILPDNILIDDALKSKLDAYLNNGGKLLLTGTSGILADKSAFAFDIGADSEGVSPYQPDYVLPAADLAPGFVKQPLIMYLPSQRIKVTTGKSLGDVYDPYFNRTWEHYCSHQHAPARTEASGYHCGVINGNIMYLAHPVFSNYRGTGAVAHKEYALKAINMLLGKGRSLKTNLPSMARVSFMEQPGENRFIFHLLFANTINRGGAMDMSGGNLTRATQSVEVIEDLLPLSDTQVKVTVPRPVTKVTLEPQGEVIPFSFVDGVVSFTVDEFTCHQMVVLHC